MRRYVTIGGIVVATVLVGSAAAYAGPEDLAPRAVSVVSADQPDPTGSSAPTSAAAAPSSAAPPAAAAPCPPAAAVPPSAGVAPPIAPTSAPTVAPTAVPVAPTPGPTTEPAPSALPAPPAPTGGAFQAAPAKAVPDVPAAGGGSTEGTADAQGSHHNGPGDGKSGHNNKGSNKTGSNKQDSAGQKSGTQDPSAQKPGEQSGSGMNGSNTQQATPAPSTSAPATPAPATPAPATPAPATPAPATSAQPTAAPAAPAPGDCAPPTGTPATPDTSAATTYSWGTPTRVDNFDGPLGSSWGVYNGPGHNGAGRRTPDAITVANGLMTMTGDEQGNSGGMAWQPGQRYGRWEARVRSHAGDPNYHAVMLLWPDAENWPVGGEVDFMEISDPTRQNTQMFLHYGQNNQQVQGSVDVDATQWHDWAVEWAPTGVTAYVDGKVWWSTKDTSILPPGPMHLCIQLDNFGGTGMKKTSMDVDWVKEYKLSPAADAGKTAEGALDTAGSAAGGLVEGAADAVGQATRPLTEGAPDPIPAVTGLVPNAVRG